MKINDIIKPNKKEPMKPNQWIRKHINQLIIQPIENMIGSQTRHLHNQIERLEKSLIQSKKLPAYITINDGNNTFVTELCWLLPGESKEVRIQPQIDIKGGAIVSIYPPFYMKNARAGSMYLISNCDDTTRECKLTKTLTPAQQFQAIITYPVPE